jgi:hypothetical protein
VQEDGGRKIIDWERILPVSCPLLLKGLVSIHVWA